jgi:methylated-DNA-protein-cysteine methyltransferase-like protein
VSDFTGRVYHVVRAVPRGKVISYGGVAAILGQPRAARGVGNALFALPDDSDVPWWRVINRNGEISNRSSPHAPILQRKLLEAEGVRFDRQGRVDWHRFGWTAQDYVTDDPDRTAPGAEDDTMRDHEPRQRRSEDRATGNSDRPARTVKSVSLSIRDRRDPAKILQVRRPPDDADLPDAWGLPAASLQPGESWHDAARRAARDKLGVLMHIGRELNRGSIRRGATHLVMRLFDATITSGEPQVPQPVAGVTQYTALRWDTTDALRPAARQGSLCCRLQLDAEGSRSR